MHLFERVHRYGEYVRTEPFQAFKFQLLSIEANIRGRRKCRFCGKLTARKDRIDYEETRWIQAPHRQKYINKCKYTTKKPYMIPVYDTVICCSDCYFRQLEKC